MTERPHPSQIRLSDAERDEAARLLGEHYAAGRLTREEHDERTTAAFAARARGELPPLFADLPGGSPWNQPAAAPRANVPYAAGRSWPVRRSPVPGVLKVLAALLLVVLVLTHLPWILLGLLVFVVLNRAVGRRRTGCRPGARAAYR
jgi:DUF1707 SHOCT-like domain